MLSQVSVVNQLKFYDSNVEIGIDYSQSTVLLCLVD